jgi:hypothetical protein
VKTAGTLEVFDTSKLDVKIQGATVSPVDPVLDTSNGKETIDITIEESNLTNLDTAGSVRLDLFENGQRVNSTIFNNGDGSYTFEQKYSKTGYYQYHVGVRESKSTVLVDTVRIDSASTISSSVSLSSNLTIKGNTGDCTSTITSVGDQFDCEIQTGESVDLTGNITVKGSQLDQFNDVEIVLRWGDKSDQQKVLYNSSTASNPIDWSKDLSNKYSSSDYNNEMTGFSNESTIEIDKNDITYNNINTQVLDLRIIGYDSSDTRIGEQSSRSLNVAPSSDITTDITNISEVDGSEYTIDIELQSDRVFGQEQINVHLFDKSGSYIETIKDVTVPSYPEQTNVYRNIDITDYADKNDDSLVMQVGVSSTNIDTPSSINSNIKNNTKYTFSNTSILNKDSYNTVIKSSSTSGLKITSKIKNENPFFDEKVKIQYFDYSDISNINNIDSSLIKEEIVTVSKQNTKTIEKQFEENKEILISLNHTDNEKYQIRKTEFAELKISNIYRKYGTKIYTQVNNPGIMDRQATIIYEGRENSENTFNIPKNSKKTISEEFPTPSSDYNLNVKLKNKEKEYTKRISDETISISSLGGGDVSDETNDKYYYVRVQNIKSVSKSIKVYYGFGSESDVNNNQKTVQIDADSERTVISGEKNTDCLRFYTTTKNDPQTFDIVIGDGCN